MRPLERRKSALGTSTSSHIQKIRDTKREQNVCCGVFRVLSVREGKKDRDRDRVDINKENLNDEMLVNVRKKCMVTESLSLRAPVPYFVANNVPRCCFNPAERYALALSD